MCTVAGVCFVYSAVRYAAFMVSRNSIRERRTKAQRHEQCTRRSTHRARFSDNLYVNGRCEASPTERPCEPLILSFPTSPESNTGSASSRLHTHMDKLPSLLFSFRSHGHGTVVEVAAHRISACSEGRTDPICRIPLDLASEDPSRAYAATWIVTRVASWCLSCNRQNASRGAGARTEAAGASASVLVVVVAVAGASAAGAVALLSALALAGRYAQHLHLRSHDTGTPRARAARTYCRDGPTTPQ
jgi:hypothetical protein